MKKLYLHMGFMKTASTSFQDTCKKNVNLLLKQGFIYPIFSSQHINLIDNPNHGIPISSIFTDNPALTHENIAFKVKNIDKLNQDYYSTLKETLEQNRSVILSGEGIPSMIEEKLILIKTFLLQYNFDIIPIIIIRSPYAYNCSLNEQISRMGGNNIHKENFYDQSDRIEKVKRIFPNTLFFPFKKACQHINGPTGFLLEHMDVDYKDFQFINTNEGGSNIRARVQFYLNNKNPFIKNHLPNPNFINITDLDSKSFTQKYLLTEKEYALIKDQCEAENTYLRENFGEEFCDKEIQFAPEKDATVKLCLELINRLEARFERQKQEIIAQFEKEINKLEIEQKNQEELFVSKSQILKQEKHILKLSLSVALYYTKFTYLRYRIASEITFGKRKHHYKEKKHKVKYLLENLKQ